MPAVRWTELAAQQLLQIRTRKLGEAVLDAADGLAQYPLLGRISPEVEQFPQLAGLRDLTMESTVRVLYEYEKRKDTVWILALSFPGQEVSPGLLGHHEM